MSLAAVLAVLIVGLFSASDIGQRWINEKYTVLMQHRKPTTAAKAPSFITPVGSNKEICEGDSTIAVGDSVTISVIEIYDALQTDTLYFDSSRHVGFVVPTFIVGKKKMLEVFDRSVVARCSDELIAVTCSGDHMAFGVRGHLPWHIPANTNLLIYFKPVKNP